jgi:alpha-beta hydrolase superfamily lysophospholipase
VNSVRKLAGTDFPGYEVLPNEARAALLIVHGIAEHSGRYRHAANALASQGIACFAYDQRSHGLNPGVRTHVDDFRQFAEDLKQVAAALHDRNPQLPLFIWGHSMGSVILTLASLDGLLSARGMITSGCALDALPSLDGLRGLGLRVANSLVPRLRIGLRIDATLLTQVEQVQREHMSDPLVPRSASLRLLHGFAAACATCKSNLPKIVQPWLAIHGEADKVCPVSGSERLMAGILSSDKQLIVYPGLLHEPHNEAEAARAAMFGAMADWIARRIATRN